MLFADSTFLTEFGVASGQAISFGGSPAILKKALYDGVRALFTEQQPQSLAALTGEQLALSLAADTVAISFAPEGGDPITAHSLNLMLLSPESKTRLPALDGIAAELGPTGPNPDEWRPQLEQAPLNDVEMDEFWRQIDASLIPHMARVSRDLVTGVVDKMHLVPRSLDYWSALCGPPLPALDQELWLKQVLDPHRRRLIERDLVKGLNLCLPMYVRDDLTLRPCTAHVSHDALWAALQQLQPIDDPFSLLGVLDLAVARVDEDERFAELAARTVERLCGEQLRRADGLDVYAFLPALVDLVQAELRILPHIASQPAYWRRLCSWTQAGPLVRAFSSQPNSVKISEHSGRTRPVRPSFSICGSPHFLILRRQAGLASTLRSWAACWPCSSGTARNAKACPPQRPSPRRWRRRPKRHRCSFICRGRSNSIACLLSNGSSCPMNFARTSTSARAN